MIYALLPLIIIYVFTFSMYVSFPPSDSGHAKLFFYIAACGVSLCLSAVFLNYVDSLILNWIFNSVVSVTILRFFDKIYEKENK
jgi:hypothetical protein